MRQASRCSSGDRLPRRLDSSRGLLVEPGPFATACRECAEGLVEIGHGRLLHLRGRKERAQALVAAPAGR